MNWNRCSNNFGMGVRFRWNTQCRQGNHYRQPYAMQGQRASYRRFEGDAVSKLSWKQVARDARLVEKCEADAVRGMQLEARYRLADGTFDFENCPYQSYVATLRLADILSGRLGRMPTPPEFLGFIDEIMKLQEALERTPEEDNLVSLLGEYVGHSR